MIAGAGGCCRVARVSDPRAERAERGGVAGLTWGEQNRVHRSWRCQRRSDTGATGERAGAAMWRGPPPREELDDAPFDPDPAARVALERRVFV